MTDNYVDNCDICGEPIDYCQGHGTIGDGGDDIKIGDHVANPDTGQHGYLIERDGDMLKLEDPASGEMSTVSAEGFGPAVYSGPPDVISPCD